MEMKYFEMDPISAFSKYHLIGLEAVSWIATNLQTVISNVFFVLIVD